MNIRGYVRCLDAFETGNADFFADGSEFVVDEIGNFGAVYFGIVQLVNAFYVVGHGRVGYALGKSHEVRVFGYEIRFAGNSNDVADFIVR